jgi:hypothetical protein
MVIEEYARENDDFSEIYIEKEQIKVHKNDQATQKYPGHITWVTTLGLLMFEEDPPKLYKIEFALELVKWFLNNTLVKMMIFRHLYRKRTNHGA